MKRPVFVSLTSLAALCLCLLLAPTLAAAGRPATSPARQAGPPASVVSAGTTITVAVIAPMNIPSLAASELDGVMLAVQQRNAAGGLLGKSVIPVVIDGQCSTAGGTAAANAAINQYGAHYIVGELCSSASVAISEIANAAHVVQISPASTNPAVTVDGAGKTKDYSFRACFTDPFQGGAAARFARGRLNATTAVIMTNPSNPYSQGLSSTFAAAFAARGGQISDTQAYTQSQTNFSTILAAIAAVHPDVVYLPDYFQVANLVTAQAKAQGIQSTFIGGDGWDSAALDLTAADGSYYSTGFAADDPKSEAQAFDQAFSAAYGHAPDSIAALSYDAAGLLFQAIAAAGVDDATLVKNSLSGISYVGVTGQITFDAQHNPNKSVVMMQVHNAAVSFFVEMPPMLPRTYTPLLRAKP